jgi:hypothetical protein
MPELGPYGSMRGEVRENLPYRDYGTKKPASKINRLRVPKVSLNMRSGKCLSAFVCRPTPGIPWNTGGRFHPRGSPALRSRGARIDTLNGTRCGAQTTLRRVPPARHPLSTTDDSRF